MNGIKLSNVSKKVFFNITLDVAREDGNAILFEDFEHNSMRKNNTFLGINHIQKNRKKFGWRQCITR